MIEAGKKALRPGPGFGDAAIPWSYEAIESTPFHDSVHSNGYNV